MPRAGSTLLCNILNMGEEFHVTPTSGTLEMIKTMRASYSQSITWRAQDRMEILDNFKNGLNGFIHGFFKEHDVVFDKNRGWPTNMSLLDEVLGNEDAKIIWCYRNPVDIIGSIESQYQKTILLENMDESIDAGAFSTLDSRIGTYINGGLVSSPVNMLIDAFEMGYGNRILFVRYEDLTQNTQAVLDHIHDFIGEPRKVYDLSQLKQNTFENDGVYNYKFLHKIKEGGVKFKESDFKIPQRYVDAINERFQGLYKLIYQSNPDLLMGIPPEYIRDGKMTIKKKKD